MTPIHLMSATEESHGEVLCEKTAAMALFDIDTPHLKATLLKDGREFCPVCLDKSEHFAS